MHGPQSQTIVLSGRDVKTLLATSSVFYWGYPLANNKAIALLAEAPLGWREPTSARLLTLWGTILSVAELKDEMRRSKESHSRIRRASVEWRPTLEDIFAARRALQGCIEEFSSDDPWYLREFYALTGLHVYDTTMKDLAELDSRLASVEVSLRS